MSERAWHRGGRGGRGAQVEQRVGKKLRAGGTNLGNVRPLSSHSSLRRQPLLSLLVDALKRAWHALRDTLCVSTEHRCEGAEHKCDGSEWVCVVWGGHACAHGIEGGSVNVNINGIGV